MAGPGLIEIAQDDSDVLLFQLADRCRHFVGETLRLFNFELVLVQVGHQAIVRLKQ